MDEEYDDLMEDVGKNTKKQKPKKLTAEEQELFDEVYADAQKRPTPNSKTKASVSTPPIIKTQTFTKTKNVTQIPPSRIGIQKLREELESATN